jgi:hypothetical protein
MHDNDRLSVAAHLHVLLRRKVGRVTDTEWMAVNADYALEIVRFARERARNDDIPELIEWAERLERLTLEAAVAPVPRKPLMEAAAQRLRRQGDEPPPPPPPPPPAAPRYVGGIR